MSSIGVAMSSSQALPITDSQQSFTGASKAEEQRYAEWLMSQAVRRELSLDERRWLDQYFWKSHGETRSVQRRKGTAGPLVALWMLAILTSGAFALFTWLN